MIDIGRIFDGLVLIVGGAVDIATRMAEDCAEGLRIAVRVLMGKGWTR